VVKRMLVVAVNFIAREIVNAFKLYLDIAKRLLW
jgi:hypothetical protein